MAAAAVVGGAAAGVTSIASSTVTAAPAVAPVVWDIPMPQQPPGPDLTQPLTNTLSALTAGGSFGGAKEAYIQGGVGRIEAVTADRAYSNAAARGVFPVTFTVQNIVPAPGGVTADVSAVASNGSAGSQNVLFVQGPSPTGWQLSKASALSLLSSVG